METDGVLATNQKGIVVFSGGTAANSLVDVFEKVAQGNKCSLSYVIPISDNGGSSSELIRVLGGPGIGDVRSRLVRLIPSNGASSERTAIKAFFNHRLSPDPVKARHEWLDIVEARHELWASIASPKKELIRSFINVLNMEIVKRARPSSVFNFAKASVGNMFLTGARLFSGSFESAIYLLSSVCAVPDHVSILPIINTNFTHHIAASLDDGTIIVGQNSISHPSVPTALPSLCAETAPATLTSTHETELHDSIEDANLPGSLPTLRRQNITFSKSDDESLPARISRVWYINPYGQEIRPAASPRVLSALHAAKAVVYSIGSLYTSIAPSLLPRGVGEALNSNGGSTAIRVKILILNGSIDRETGPPGVAAMTAMDFVAAIAKAAGGVGKEQGAREMPGGLYASFVTHVVYLDSPGAPKVDREQLAGWGIETVKLYGRKNEDGKGVRYDATALTQALEAIIGRKMEREGPSRRNTLHH
ncbi:MAG: hypothetical protein M1821_000081 [Bathelium mastoideum]|nr:MAG: hypothetical protein M1821_000081 [Bathelium mastoideum]